MKKLIIVKSLLKTILLIDFLYFILEELQKKNFISISLIASNLRQLLSLKKIFFRFDSKKKLFYVKDGNNFHYFHNIYRGYPVYRHGINFRGNAIFQSYSLNKIRFKSDDIVIDCGSNYADLWIKLKKFIKPKNYITFEPGKNEFITVVANSPNSINNNIALSNKNTITKFYLNESEADSSIIKPRIFNKIIKVKTTSLTNYVKKNELRKIKLLKIDTEGFELEVLHGAAKILKKIEFISVDCGFERGVYLEETFSKCTNFLLKKNFQIISINQQFLRVLFKNLR